MAHFDVVVSDRVIETAYRAMQRRFCATKHGFRIPPVHRMPGHADGNLKKQVSAVDQEGFLDGLFDGLGNIANVVLRFDPGNKQRKFIGSKPPNDRPVPAALLDELAAQPVADRAQQFRAGVITHRLVNEAEAVNVQ